MSKDANKRKSAAMHSLMLIPHSIGIDLKCVLSHHVATCKKGYHSRPGKFSSHSADDVACLLQQMEVLAFTTMVISALAAIIHFASVNIIHNEGTGSVPGGHICNPGDVACEQNYNFVIVM